MDEMTLVAPSKLERSQSTLQMVQSGDLRVVPLIAIDFSLGNLNIEDNSCIHSTNPTRQNHYRDLTQMIATSYQNVLNLPIFGFGALTNPRSTLTSPLFPLSRSIRNPFTPNEAGLLEQNYSDCL